MIPKRIASAVINSLKGGVVPRVGLPYMTVGRKDEIASLVHDIDIVGDGGASFRFIVGKYGSGKSFLLQTVRNYCMDKNFVVADADLSPERRLMGNNGQGKATYRELLRNMSVKNRPDGGALPLILDRLISKIQTDVASETGLDSDSAAFEKQVYARIAKVIGGISDMVHGFDFSRLLFTYYKAYIQSDDELKSRVIRWFRGEYATKTEAKADLQVSVIIGDDDWYDYIKIFAYFLKQAGYSGLIILIDELVNIYKIPHSITRQYNYEKILTMYNDTLQGKAAYLGIIMGGTPQCVEDTHRGLFSYEALRSRLAEGRFATENVHDLLSPIIRLSPLSPEEMLILTEKLCGIHGVLYDYTPRVTQEHRMTFIKIEYARVGAAENVTPREIIRDFIELLDILYQHPEQTPEELLQKEEGGIFGAVSQSDVDGAFAEFSL